MAVFDSLRRRISSLFSQEGQNNRFNQGFYSFLGGGFTEYDPYGEAYLEKGYLYNPTVFAVIKQMSDKAKSIPIVVKRVKDKNAKQAYDRLRLQTKGSFTPAQEVKRAVLETKAYEESEVPFPMDRPNELQTWGDIVALYQVFMATTGNFYLYLHKGDFESEPLQVYVLPSHLMQIVLKGNANMLGTESPIDYYMLIEGNQFIDFPAEEIIHIKTPNPDYDQSGSHLYGLSPLRAALRNIQSSNEAISNNIRTLKNSGAFGFITGKNIPLTPDQAESVKERLLEMRSTTEALGQIQGASAELEFTRISLTTDELKPFDYLSFDEKQICNVLGWDDKLLNNDKGAKYDNVEWAQKRVLIDTIMPSLDTLAEHLNQFFLPLFKSYQGTVLEFDYSECPELQIDIEKLVGWAVQLVDRGVLNRDEVRALLRYPALETPEMMAHTVQMDVIELGEAISNDLRLQ